jgi:serine protease AprX
MASIPCTPLRSAQWYRCFAALALVALCSALLITAQPQALTPRAAPRLLQLALEQPSTLISVVVQKQVHDQSIEALLTNLGGTILRDLPIINGFSAKLRASAISNLAYADGIRWISLDTPVIKQACTGQGCIDPARLAAAYPQTISADRVWNRATPLRGQGVGVAVLDSGVNPQQDLYDDVTWKDRIVASVSYNDGWNQTPFDMYGHGNQVAQIIAGNGSTSNGDYVGIAPRANLINVKISNDLNEGTATTSSLVAGMQWIYDNRAKYNIRVVNISLTDSIVESYNVSVLDAAVEQLWFNGIVVVVAAGNGGAGSVAAPANDPFVITVGAADDQATSSPSDDTIPAWSSYGPTIDGFAKPDLVAPGVSLTAPMPVVNSRLAQSYPKNVSVGQNGWLNFTMSGTSVAAPVVAGAVALLLQDEPRLTPDQVKYRLMVTAKPIGSAAQSGAGELNIQRAVDATTTQSANTGTAISQLNNDGSAPSTWTSTKWSTAKWSTAKWSTAKWSTAKWSTSAQIMTPPRIKTK